MTTEYIIKQELHIALDRAYEIWCAGPVNKDILIFNEAARKVLKEIDQLLLL